MKASRACWGMVGAAVFVVALALASGLAGAQPPAAKGWVKGKGYGWIWGPNDEIGALNAITPQKVMAALAIPKQGRVYDLGAAYDRASFQWPGHSPAEVISFRTPEGVKRQKDLGFMQGKKDHWHSSAIFISDPSGGDS
ncbi:MAG: hypothetical protein ACREK6_12240 [Candidatus Rokuibacteriota bacterium]